MAQHTITRYVDDLDGSEASETIHFALDGKQYEIDLNEGHAQALRESFAEWVDVARKAGGGRRARQGGTGRSTVDREQAHAIRQWARARGMTVAERGRIPVQVIEAYNHAA